MKTYYIVNEEYKEYDCVYEKCIGIATTEDIAQKIVDASTESHNSLNVKIDQYTWYDMYDQICSEEMIDYTDDQIINKMAMNFPRYSKKEIEDAYKYYDVDPNYQFTRYYPVNVYENENDLCKLILPH